MSVRKTEAPRYAYDGRFVVVVFVHALDEIVHLLFPVLIRRYQPGAILRYLETEELFFIREVFHYNGSDPEAVEFLSCGTPRIGLFDAQSEGALRPDRDPSELWCIGPGQGSGCEDELVLLTEGFAVRRYFTVHNPCDEPPTADEKPLLGQIFVGDRPPLHVDAQYFHVLHHGCLSLRAFGSNGRLTCTVWNQCISLPPDTFRA
jgi:hypothetical protein